MSDSLEGQVVAILAADGVERVELEKPREAILAAGGRVEVLSPRPGEIQARDHDLVPAGTVRVDRAVGAASVDDYAGLILPGGTVNPDKLRIDPDAVRFVHEFVVSWQAGGRNLSRSVDAGGGTRAVGPDGDVVSQHPYRSPQCRRLGARRGSRHRPQPHHQPIPRRSTGVLSGPRGQLGGRADPALSHRG